MERKQWLTLLYREANLFLENQEREGNNVGIADLEELEPALHSQLSELRSNVDHLEDLVKYSLLKDPMPDLWQGEKAWGHVLLNVAAACLLHDVKGVIVKIVEGTLPRTPSAKLLDPI